MAINKNNSIYIYIDSSIIISQCFDINNERFITLNRLCKENNIEQIYTDITKKEIIENFNKNLDFLKTCKIQLPSSYKQELVNKISKDFSFIQNEYWSDKIKVDYNDIKISTIVDSYFDKIPPFSVNKQNEFKDSIILNSILQFTEIRCGQTYLVSKDKDWHDFALLHDHFIKIFSNIQELTAYLNNAISFYEKITYFYIELSSELVSFIEDDLHIQKLFCIGNQIYIEVEEDEDIIIDIYEIDSTNGNCTFSLMFNLLEANEIINKEGMCTKYKEICYVHLCGEIKENKIIKCQIENLITNKKRFEKLVRNFFKEKKFLKICEEVVSA